MTATTHKQALAIAREAGDRLARDGYPTYADAIRDTVTTANRQRAALTEIDSIAYSALYGSKEQRDALKEIRFLLTKALKGEQ